MAKAGRRGLIDIVHLCGKAGFLSVFKVGRHEDVRQC
jgi:hypothetical protein